MTEERYVKISDIETLQGNDRLRNDMLYIIRERLKTYNKEEIIK